jgi:hypothetical protein
MFGKEQCTLPQFRVYTHVTMGNPTFDKQAKNLKSKPNVDRE